MQTPALIQKFQTVGRENIQPCSKPKAWSHLFIKKDIGVYIDHNLSFDKYISTICNKANCMFVELKRSFQYHNKETFITLYKTLAQTYLDYTSSVITMTS